MKETARTVALQTLYACDKQGAWSDGALKKAIHAAGLDSRDAALATQLCAGVLQNRMLLDFYLSRFSNVALDKLEPKVLTILRLGVYQLLFLDRVPASAAVNTAVELARQSSRNPRSPGLVNGILRSVARSQNDLPPLPSGEGAGALSVRYSHPEWLVEAFLDVLGPVETELLLQCDNQRPATTAQVNGVKTTRAALCDALTAEGVKAQPHPWLAGCVTLTGSGDLERLEAWRSGDFYIQDVAARLAVTAAGVKPGMTVLDACAAPGGKSFAAAIDMANRGAVYSCDIHPYKLKLIEAGAERLGLDVITPYLQNAAQRREAWHGFFDVVLADVPCSGLGVIRKKPDIRYKDASPLAELPRIQRAILDNVADYVKPGGILLYSTCTVLPRENEGIITAFLEQHSDFTAEPFQLPEPVGTVSRGQITLWPHRHGTDGFYMARLRKAAGA